MRHTTKERLCLVAVVLGVYGVMALLLVALAHAIVLPDMIDGARQTDGTLVTAQTVTGATNTSVCTGVRSGTPTLSGGYTCRGGYYRSIAFFYCNTSGTATVSLKVNCAGAGWAPVTNSSKSIGVECDAVSIILPQCAYEADITACSGCSTTITYDAGTAVK